jgi:hypothetical protein
MTMAVERLALKGSAAAAAASASRVFLLRLPGGRPRLRGTGGVAAGSFALRLQPRLRWWLRATTWELKGEKQRRPFGEEKEWRSSGVGKTLEGSEI